MTSLKKIQDRLRSAGYSVTDPRQTVIQYLLDSKQNPQSSKKIYENLKHTGIDRSTVYRTINLFTELGILDQIFFRDGVTRIELSPDYGGNHHHHLVCEDCGQVFEFEECGIDTVKRLAEVKHQFDVRDHQMEFFGLCEDCQDKAA